MTQNITNDSDDKKNNKANVYQIIYQNELIYLVKLVAFIFMACSIFNGLKEVDEISTKDFAGVFIFVFTTVIDAAGLGKAFKVKGKINIVLIGYILLLLFSFCFVALIFTEQLKNMPFWIDKCVLMGFFCCLSPILEMIYDIIWRLQNEKQRNY